jgi:RecG-like helicase
VSSWELAGPFVALRTVRDRQHFVARVTVDGIQAGAPGRNKAMNCVVTDGTGELTLVFLGRSSVPGLRPGSRCVIEGTARTDGCRLVVLNPLYRIESNAD